MHPLTTLKANPSIWVTWLAKYLANEAMCDWPLWFRTNHVLGATAGGTSTGTFGNHTAFVKSEATEWRKTGYHVTVENQNKFGVDWFCHLVGKPDIVAVADDHAWVIDAKTGKMKDSHTYQVMIYMWALPQVRPELSWLKLSGKVSYANGTARIIYPSELDQEFRSKLFNAIRTAMFDDTLPKVPSFEECRYCPITSADCKDRVEPHRSRVSPIADERE
jgi:CRISPR/Cas system-associated exonuclease Cas4 (RecB family)